MKNIMIKSIIREIKKSFSRWFAITAIIALGVGFFAGLKVCKESFWITGDNFLKEHNFFDFKLLSTLGFDDDSVKEIAKIKGISMAEGSYSSDIIVQLSNNGKNSNKDSLSDSVAKFHTISKNISTPSLIVGKMPKTNSECLVDANRFSKEDIGKTLYISDSNTEETLKNLAFNSYKITGLAKSPLYLNYERGSTSLGDGTVSYFVYIPEEGWNMDFFTEVYVTLEKGGAIFSDEYINNAKKLEKPLEKVLETTAKQRYDSVLNKVNSKLSKAEAKLAKAKSQLKKGETKLKTKEIQLLQNQSKILKAEKEIKNNKILLKEKEKELSQAKTELEEGWKKCKSGLEELSNNKALAYEELKPLETALNQANGTPSYEQVLLQYNRAKEKIDENFKEAEAALNNTKKTLELNEAKLLAGEKELSKGELEISKAIKKLQEGQSTLKEGNKKLETAHKNLKKAKDKIFREEDKFRKAKNELKKIKNPTTYVLGRDTNVGYVCFESDTNIVDGIAKVFPIFFFLVAALVVMTTMTRMVDEQRTQIGTMKALGYGKIQILLKYVFYALSGALVGGFCGFYLGSHLFPATIWKAYGIMYGFAPLTFYINPSIGSLSILVAVICAVGTTIYSCYGELLEVPAQLIRPKAPALGKRVFLEKVSFIWKRLSFLHKVTARNIFRYKKRFFMMVMGICGCTALLLTGLGLNDSIKGVVDAQYDEIMHADYIVNFDRALRDEEKTDFLKENKNIIKDALFTYNVSMEARYGKKTKSVNLVVCNEKDKIEKFIDIHDEDGKKLNFPKKGDCIVNSNLALRLGLKIGDTITLRDSDMNEVRGKISGLCENFVYNYMYINKETYQAQQGDFEMNSAFLLGVKDNANKLQNPSEGAAQLMKSDHVAAVSISQAFRDRISNMMKSLDYVVALVIACAGALAFIVLYNLTNINITERIREIATIKVLGFNRRETASYVFRENLALTGISALIGLPLGNLLHLFVMSRIVVDLISFHIHINLLSYILSVVITFLFALLVNLVLFFKLDKINMAESLKSIE